MSVTLEIDLFTDPACPFAFSAEPVRQRLRWHYGDALRWTPRMIVLTHEPGEAEKLAQGAPSLQRRYGMPIRPEPYARPASSEPACRAVVAARINAPDLAEALLRALRVRTMAGGLLDDPQLIAAAARDAGLEPGDLERWSASDATGSELEHDICAARSPVAAARTLDHKLGGPAQQRRYTAPSYVIAHDGREAVVPGFNPFEAYDVAIANLAPDVERRAAPGSITELLEWASEPLATAELVAVSQRDEQAVRAELARITQPTAVGAELYWSLV